jgi:hypothetical protein
MIIASRVFHQAVWKDSPVQAMNSYHILDRTALARKRRARELGINRYCRANLLRAV